MTLKLEPSDKEYREPRKLFDQFQDAIWRLTRSATEKLAKAQKRYKRNYDNRVRTVRQPDEGDWVYLRRETLETDPEGVRWNHKLEANATGPYQIIRADEHSVVIDTGDEVETVTRQRVVRAPDPLEMQPDKDHTEPTSLPYTIQESILAPSRNRRHSEDITGHQPREDPETAVSNDTTVEAVLGKILGYDPQTDLFKVKWHGYPAEDATEEPPAHLPYYKMAQYFRKRRKLVPEHIRRLHITN